jgi:hypothetical protein
MHGTTGEAEDCITQAASFVPSLSGSGRVQEIVVYYAQFSFDPPCSLRPSGRPQENSGRAEQAIRTADSSRQIRGMEAERTRCISGTHQANRVAACSTNCAWSEHRTPSLVSKESLVSDLTPRSSPPLDKP